MTASKKQAERLVLPPLTHLDGRTDQQGEMVGGDIEVSGLFLHQGMQDATMSRQVKGTGPVDSRPIRTLTDLRSHSSGKVCKSRTK